MAITRLVSGVLREVWQEAAAQNGGVTAVVTTGIRISAGQLSSVEGLLTVTAAAGTPNFPMPTLAVVGGFLTISVANIAAPGNTGTWTLDVKLVHSHQQARRAGTGYILVAGGGASGLANGTLATTYAAGAAQADQTMVVLDAKGGGIIVDGSNVGLTDINPLSFTINAPASGAVAFRRIGGFTMQSTVSVLAENAATWNDANFQGSTVTLTGGPDTALSLAMVNVGQATINGATNSVTDAYDLRVGNAPSGTATLTRSWSLGVQGNAQFKENVVLGPATIPGTGAVATLVASSASTPPVSSVGRAHYFAEEYSGQRGSACWSVFQEEPVTAAAGTETPDKLIPFIFNGARVFLLAVDPPS